MGRTSTTTTITTRTTIPMSDLMRLTQWLSPAFPLGSFAYSHGLEQVIAAGEVVDRDGLVAWLSDILEFGAGQSDALLMALTHRGADVGEMAALARALAPTSERWEETREQGSAFARTVRALDIPCEDAALPVALGQAARALSLTSETVAGLYLHSFASNLVSAAVRFVPLGQTEGQQALGALHPVIDGVARWAAGAEREDLGTCAIRADLGAALHETMEVRIFRT